jgi:hypothetical protein
VIRCQPALRVSLGGAFVRGLRATDFELRGEGDLPGKLRRVAAHDPAGDCRLRPDLSARGRHAARERPRDVPPKDLRALYGRIMKERFGLLGTARRIGKVLVGRQV